jgi:hypothetical protein
VRRKFFELHAANGSPIAAEALRRIAGLYAVEWQASGLSAETRLQLRREQAKPVLAELHAWLLATQTTVATGSMPRLPSSTHASTSDGARS